MSAVEVDIADAATEADLHADEARPSGGSDGPERNQGRTKARREPKPEGSSVEVEVEREITKRQLIQSISTIVVVILYMVFTLLRDRDSGVVVVDPDESDEDWDEG